MDVSPPGDHRPTVEITDDGGCPGCLYKKALLFLLEHGTGTGRLILDADDLAELEEAGLSLLLVCLKNDEEKNADN